QRPVALLRGERLRADVAGGVPPEARAVVAGDPPFPRCNERWPQLRLRPLRPERRTRGAGRARSVFVESRVQWCRAGARRDTAALRGSVRTLRVPPRGVRPLLRPGRG